MISCINVLDYWVCLQDLNFYKTKNNLFNVYNLPSSLATSRNKFIEKYFFKVDRFFSNNYLFTYHLEITRDSIIPFQLSGNLTITYYLFFNLIIKYLLYLIIRSKIVVFTIFLGLNIFESFNKLYLLEEIINKFLEIILANLIFSLIY